MTQCFWIKARDKLGLLSALMHILCGDETRLILEGKLEEFNFGNIESYAVGDDYKCDMGNSVLSLKLTEDNIKQILNQIQPDGKYVKAISHIQIKVKDDVQVLIGDNFHNQCISVGPLVKEEYLVELANKHIISSYETDAEAKAKCPWFKI